jgi:phospholipid/cholesterol/gamma-HCH transport system substrate-binding protein
MTRRRRAGAAIAASPVLVGAVTVLISIIAVFIAYTANLGLPFVPTYDLKAELPSGNKLVIGNEVRLGGFRVGVVDDMKPRTVMVKGHPRAIALLSLKIDKTAEPLPVDTHMQIRPRSALGLKYVQVDPGRSSRKLANGDTVPLRNNSEPLEIEDLLSTFQPQTRTDVRKATAGFGDAFAGRGQNLNRAIGALNPFLRALVPVMKNLSNPDTGLNQFFRQLGGTVAQIAPVAHTNAVLFTNMATTFAAISSDPRALQATIEKGPSTQDVAISSFRAQRPFLADFADLSRRLQPAARQLPRSLPALNRAFAVGTPVLPKTVGLSDNLREATLELEDLFQNPNTLLALQDLDTTLTVTRPAIEFIGPYQTVCDYGVYMLHSLGEHQSLLSFDKAGTTQNQGAKFPNPIQPNNYGTTESSRPVDVPPGQKARGATFMGLPAHRFESPPPAGGPAIDAQGNADCQHGQEGYPNGPLVTGGRYGGGALSDGTPAGGNAMVADGNFPILSGGTFVTRKLGIKNLHDIP